MQLSFVRYSKTLIPISSIRNMGFLLCASFLCFSCEVKLADDVAVAYEDLTDELDFNIQGNPVGPDEAKREVDLRLDISENAIRPMTSNGQYAIKEGSLKSSEVYHRIVSDDLEYMIPTPSSNLKLTAKEKAIIIKWIEEGANYKEHWAFIKLNFDLFKSHYLPDYVFEIYGKNSRDPETYVANCLMAGAGVKPGFSYGLTDDCSDNKLENPIHVHDFHATLMHLMGIDHEKLVFKYQGRRYRLTDVHGRVDHDILS